MGGARTRSRPLRRRRIGGPVVDAEQAHPFLALQAVAGNQAVQRLAEAAIEGDVIVGLKEGDGLRPGAEGEQARVKELQRLLNEAMLANLAVDGKLGPKTLAAVQEFQVSTDLKVTTTVDRFTAQHLRTGGGGRAVGPSGTVAAQADAREKERAEDETEAANSLSRAADAQREGVNRLGDAGRTIEFQSGGLTLSRAAHQLNIGVDGINNAVYALWDDAAVRAAHRAGAGSPGGNALVGLRKGDGMTSATIDRRDRVKLLQTRLNLEGGAGLTVDGKFGDATALAVEMFSQAKLGISAGSLIGGDLADRLMGREPDPGGPYSEKGLGRGAKQLPLIAEWMGVTAERHSSAAAGTGNVAMAAALRRAGAAFAQALGHLNAAGSRLGRFPDGLDRPAEDRPVSPTLERAEAGFDRAAEQLRKGGDMEREAGEEMDERAVGSALVGASQIWDFHAGHWGAAGRPMSRV